jgi:hypothetical protein
MVATGQHPPRYRKVAQMLDFDRDPLEPENAQMAMRLARARRARVTLRLAVQCGVAPSCTLRLFVPAAVFLIFLVVILFSAILALSILGGAIDRLVIAVVSVKSGILLVFIGKLDATPLAQATCTVPKPVPRWWWLPQPRGSYTCCCGGGGRASRRGVYCRPARATTQC